MTRIKKIFFWSPMLGNVGTIKATINSIESILDNSDHEIFILNVFGEFSFYINESKRIKKINFFTFLRFLPKTGLFSKFLIYFFSLLAFPLLFIHVAKHRPNIIYSSLVGYLPLLLKIFFKDLKIFNSIQGYPRFNKIRKLIWKEFYMKSDLIITMTENTKNKLINDIGNFKEIKKIFNPVIDDNLYKLSNVKILSQYENIISKKIQFISIGRLTRQKNNIEFLKALNILKNELGLSYYEKNINVIFLGEGEDLIMLNKFVKDSNLHNIYFLGFQKNPFNFLKASNFYVSTSLWEDPGHTLIEAASLKIPIITSDCPSGPRELFNEENSYFYKSRNIEDLSKILIKVVNETEKKEIDLKQKILKAKEISENFTKEKFYESIKDYL